MPLLQHIPVKSLVGIILEYWIDVEPVMDKVIRDIQILSMYGSPTRLLGSQYHERIGCSILDAVLLSKFSQFKLSYEKWRSTILIHDKHIASLVRQIESHISHPDDRLVCLHHPEHYLLKISQACNIFCSNDEYQPHPPPY